MMKISHILYLSEMPGQSAFSGAENHVMTLLPALKASGAEVELIAIIWTGGPSIQSKLDALRKQGICVAAIEREQGGRFKTRLSMALRCWLQLYRLLIQRRHRIIHVHLDLKVAIMIAWLARCSRIILSIHNDEQFYRRLFWRIWLRIINHPVKAYIAISKHVQNYYLMLSGIHPNKISTVYYGIECPFQRRPNRQDFQIDPYAFVVGFVGRLTHQKNLKVFIDALAEMPEVTGVIIGAGELRDELESWVMQRKMRNIIFLGPVPNAVALMPLFDIFCLPSLWEGLGLVLIEAMLQKIPIVGSHAGAIPEILGDGKYGLLFDPYSPLILVEKIKFARANVQIMKQMAEEAFEYASTQFSVEQMVKRTLNVYQTV